MGEEIAIFFLSLSPSLPFPFHFSLEEAFRLHSPLCSCFIHSFTTFGTVLGIKIYSDYDPNVAFGEFCTYAYTYRQILY